MERNQWLTTEHPIYTACKETWSRNERRYRAGRGIEPELIPFDWEVRDGEHHNARKGMLTYVNFMERYATMITGSIFEKVPQPKPNGKLDFGTLGEVSRTTNLNRPSNAELIYFNADGVGIDGSHWWNFWRREAKWATVTGHRWILVEGPPARPRNQEEEINGLRPFLTGFSPLSVPNWEYQSGRLTFAIIQRSTRRVKIVNDSMEGNSGEAEFLLVVRRGNTTFDAIVPGLSTTGGWAVFDADGNLTARRGEWDSTRGEIPLFPLYYERVAPSDTEPAMSRTGQTEIGNGAVGYMNLASAADFDSWDAGTTVKALRGVDDAGFNLFVAKVRQGNRYAPLPPVQSGTSMLVPEVEDVSGGVQVAGMFDNRLRNKRKEILELMLSELKVSDDASGVARDASWTDTKAPRVSEFAGEIEAAINIALPFLEMMWGGRITQPRGSVELPREFKLIDPVDAGIEFLTTQQLSGAYSPTMTAKVMVNTARASGFLGDDEEEKKVRGEYEESAKLAAEMKAAAFEADRNDASRNGPNNSTPRPKSSSRPSTGGGSTQAA